MPFQTGTSTDYKDLLAKLVSFCTGNNVTAAAINAGGTGYVVGDVLTVSGGTSTWPCTLEVTAVSAGVITAVKILTSGAYTVNPTNPVSVTGGTGTGATFNLTLNTGNWTANRNTKYASVAAINAGGTGYNVGNILTVSGGTSTITAELYVSAVSGGVITAVTFNNRGAYSAVPTNPVSVTGGDGTGATFNLTWEDEVQLQGIGSGSDQVYIGIRTYQNVGVDAFNWEVAGFTGYTASLEWKLQPGKSTGGEGWIESPGTINSGGNFVPLDDASMTFWLNQNGRRVIGIVKCGTSSYMSFYAGFIDPFNTTTEHPYPMYIGSSVCQQDTRFNSTRAAMSSFVNPREKQVSGVSPFRTSSSGVMRFTDGVWWSHFHMSETPGSPTTLFAIPTMERVVYPPGAITRANDNTSPNNCYLSIDHTWHMVVPTVGGTPTFELRSTPGATDDFMTLFPPTLVWNTPSQQFVGQLSDTYWISDAGSALTSEDEVDIGTDTYIIFQQGNLTDGYNYLALKRT